MKLHVYTSAAPPPQSAGNNSNQMNNSNKLPLAWPIYTRALGQNRLNLHAAISIAQLLVSLGALIKCENHRGNETI